MASAVDDEGTDSGDPSSVATFDNPQDAGRGASDPDPRVRAGSAAYFQNKYKYVPSAVDAGADDKKSEDETDDTGAGEAKKRPDVKVTFNNAKDAGRAISSPDKRVRDA